MMGEGSDKAQALEPPLSGAEFRRLVRLAGRLPRSWTASARRRRFLFLGLAAPGFAAVFATPLHQNLAVLLFGFGLFAAAWVFRRRTERVFARAEAAALWPPTLPSTSPETASHA
jgi:hypothetical protein